MTKNERENFNLAKMLIESLDNGVSEKIAQLRSEAENDNDIIRYVRFDQVKTDVFSWVVKNRDEAGWDGIKREIHKVVKLCGGEDLIRKVGCALNEVEKNVGWILSSHCNYDEWDWIIGYFSLCHIVTEYIEFGEFNDD